MNIVDLKKLSKLIGSEGGAAIVVDSLPTENIKPNVIYAVRSVEYYTSLYGTKMPTLTATNQNDWENTAAVVAEKRGLTLTEIQALGMAAGQFGFAVSDCLVHDNGIDYISKNIFDSGMFVWECAGQQTGTTTDQFSIKRSFNTVVELYEYLLSENFVKDVDKADGVGGDLGAFASGVVDTLKSLNFKYQTTPLTADEIGVVAQDIYSYYMYDGQDWVKLGENVVIKEITNEQSKNLDGVTFTIEEFNRLVSGAQLVLKTIGLPLYYYCHLVQKIDLSGADEKAIGLYYRTGEDFILGNYENTHNISFVVGYQTNGSDISLEIAQFNKEYNIRINRDVSIVWEEDDTYKSLGYNYKGAIQGYSGNTAIITFSPEDAASGNFSTFGTGGGSEYNYQYFVYAKTLPDHTVTVDITVL